MKVIDVKKIVLFRALQIGDMLCSIPAIRALRQAYPGAEITLVGLPWAKMLLERFPDYFNAFIEFPGFPGFPEQSADVTVIPDFLKSIQQQQFDLALQMQGNGTISNVLVSLFGAKYNAGFYKDGNYCPDKNLFIEYPDKIHEIKRHLKLMEYLEIPAASTKMEFPVTAKDLEDFAKAALPVQPGNYVIIHPGARGQSRRWSAENFAAVGDFCKRRGYEVVVTGTPDEMEIVNSVIASMQHKPINAAGKTSLGAVAILIDEAAALVSNCTGVSHIAAALETRSVVVSLDEEPYRWAPLNKDLHITIDWELNGTLDNVLDELSILLEKDDAEGS